MKELETKRTRREVIEEHLTVLAEPESRYFGHFPPSSGTAKNIANTLSNFAKTNKLTLAKFKQLDVMALTQTLAGTLA